MPRMSAQRLLAAVTIVLFASSACSAGIRGERIDTILALNDVAQRVEHSDLSQSDKRLFDEAVAREQMENGSTCYEIREGETVGEVIAETRAYDDYWRNWKAEQNKTARRTGVEELSICWDFPTLSEYLKKRDGANSRSRRGSQ